jgi:primosomal protein N' (replication factor Y)
MVTKGLDFERVNLVGVFDIDRALHFPDFRAHERVFQLLTQVSGRAGRHSGKGLVLIQTANPAHPVLELVQAHQYEQFYQREIAQRQLHHYPPFYRLIKITVKGEELSTVLAAAKQLASLLAASLGKDRVLGPEAPLIARIRNLHLLDILIKMDRQRMNPSQVKKLISECSQQLTVNRKYKKLLIVPDVDPL